jgi:hypothetical protein
MVNANGMSPMSVTHIETSKQLQERVLAALDELQVNYGISDVDLELFRSLTYKLLKPKENCTQLRSCCLIVVINVLVLKTYSPDIIDVFWSLADETKRDDFNKAYPNHPETGILQMNLEKVIDKTKV